ncbi:MAG: hypothetical protein P1P80_04595 [ANME-2 cluster archaeon]|nr:hypothetical protein [ANME-2 cluster archaeon]
MSFLVKSAIKILWEKIFHMVENDLPDVRPTLGDYVNTVETQKRLDYVLFHNPNMVGVEYNSALNSTKENVGELHEKKKLNHSMFRNFTRREPEKALKLLKIINRNIYAPIFQMLGKGYGKVVSVDPPSRHVTYEIRSCNECLGLPDVDMCSCFHFSGILAGIFSAIFQQSMGVYESECGTNGGHTCNYEIGNIQDMVFGSKVDNYLKVKISPNTLREIGITLQKNILESLSQSHPVETKVGSYVHIFVYQLRILNTLEQNPEIFSEMYHKAGARFSHYLADILRQFYHVDGEKLLTEAMPKYYKKQLLANIQSVKKFQDGYLITFTEAMDCAGIKKLDIKPCSFMKGEIEGIANIATGKTIECDIHSCRFDTGEHLCQYRLSYVVEEKDIPEWLKDIQEQ